MRYAIAPREPGESRGRVSFWRAGRLLMRLAGPLRVRWRLVSLGALAAALCAALLLLFLRGPGMATTAASHQVRAASHGKRAGHDAMAAARSGTYVALGDSYAAGPMIPDQTGRPAGCKRSDHDYPSDIAAAVHPHRFVDVTCSGATTTDMTHPQRVAPGVNPPQLSAVTSRDSLVTLTISGNDIGFSRIIWTCAVLSLTDPPGAPCKAHYTAGGADQLARAIVRTAPKVDAVLRAIRARAPRARVLLVGYPDILPNTGNGCWPVVPFARGDVPYLRGVEKKLNQMLATAASSEGATYVDTYSDSIGHDACAPPKARWLESLVLDVPAVPFHPNRKGEQEMAAQALAALR